MAKHVGIVGGGIMGLFTAYYLRQAGHDVTILDQTNGADGCSHGNAGMIVPSHIIPLAAPGMIAKGVRWMFNSRSPFFVRPRLSLALASWGYQFYRHANRRHVEYSIPALKSISFLSKAAYQVLSKSRPFDFGYLERGLLMLYQTAAAEHEEGETAAIANQHGVEAQVLTLSQIQALEPHQEVNARGAVFFPGDAHLNPNMLISGLRQWLSDHGVAVHTGTTVSGFRQEQSRMAGVITNKGEHGFDEIVIAAGAWSGSVSRMLQLNLPMQAGKGYSFMIPDMPSNIQTPSLLLEARVAVTPLGNSLRLGGTMEIAGVDHSINMNRVQGIVDAVPKYYPGIKPGLPAVSKVWHGLRPCSPDGLPYIGRTRRYPNVIVAAGHGMMGISLAPGTAQLVTSLINDSSTAIDLAPFNPNRYA